MMTKEDRIEEIAIALFVTVIEEAVDGAAEKWPGAPDDVKALFRDLAAAAYAVFIRPVEIKVTAITSAELDYLTAIEAEITPAPWTSTMLVGVGQGSGGALIKKMRPSDASFVAVSRNSFLGLIAAAREAERLRALVGEGK